MPSFRFPLPLRTVATPLSGSPSRLAIRSLFVGLFAALLLCCATANAQVDLGQIAGVVADQSGAVIPGASVTAKNLNTNAQRSTVTSSTGVYQIPGLEPGMYQVSVASGSFKAFTAKVEVTVGGKVMVDAKLSVSSAVTEVEVIGEGGAQVNTQSQEMSQVVDTKQLAQLPSLTRNPYDFVALSGNVSSGDNTGNSTSSGQNLTNRGVGFAINGQRESGTEILLDGVENVSIYSVAVGQDVPVDSVQEYSIITNNYSAEYGRASGGVVNVTTKAGTNSYHGSAWEYNRLSAYTANTYDNDTNGLPKGTYTRNQFGYAAGGPIIKNKLFIFESTEWTRVRSAASLTEENFDPAFIALMPTNIQNYYKTYGQTTLQSAGVAATVDDIVNSGASVGQVNGATALPGSTPVFDTINFKAPFDAGGGIPENQYTLVGRLDYNPTEKTSMYFRGGRENENQFQGSTSYSTYPQYNTGTTNLNQSYLYTITHTFNPSVFFSAKASYTRFNENTSFDTSLVATPSLMFVSPTDPVTGGTIQMPGLQNASEPGSGGVPVGGPQNTIQVEPDLSWTTGKHSLRFGGLITYIQLNYVYGAYAQAVEELGATFQDSLNDMMNTAGNPNGAPLTTFEARVDPQGKMPCAVDQSFTDGSFGLLTAAQENSSCAIQTPVSAANYARSYRYKDWDLYAEDNFKVTPQLTLNLGLRYEHYGVQHNNKSGLDSNFYFGSGNGVEQQVRSGQVQIASQSAAGGFWKPRWGTLAPRIGFAYDVFGNGRDSIRGGYGISYERNFGNVTYNASFNPPASAVISDTCAAESANCIATVTNDDLGPLGKATGTQYLPPVAMRHLDQNIQVAQTQFWSLAVQHQLMPGTVIEVSYSGSRDSHLYDLANVNQVGAGQVYMGDPVVTGAACTHSGYTNNNIYNSVYAADINAGYTTSDAGDDATTKSAECLTRPNAQYSDMNMRGSAAASSYNALNLKFQTQNIFGTGLSLSANYTWSHSLDDLSSTFGDSLQGGSGYVGPLGYTSLADPGLDWGSSDFDVRNRLGVSPIWEMPWFKHGSTLEREALGGWTLSGIYTARGGVPFSIFDYNNVETYYTMPRLEPATPFYSVKVNSKPKMLGPNKFSGLDVPAPKSSDPLNSALGISDLGPFPSDMMRRNSVRGPGAWNFDAALHKTFPLTEKVGLEFGAEGINVLNHHNYYVNTTTLADPTYIQEKRGGLGSTATGGNHDERRFGQFSLQVTF